MSPGLELAIDFTEAVLDRMKPHPKGGYRVDLSMMDSAALRILIEAARAALQSNTRDTGHE